MKIILADVCGFCFGVEKAIDMAFDEINRNEKSGPIYALGELIHNPQVIEKLKNAGVQVIDTLNGVTNGTVIIRSHGVGKETYDLADSKSLKIVDTTCPFVKRIQKIVAQYVDKRYQIVIVGNSTHPEVIGINGWCNNKAYIINDENDLINMPKTDKICVVAQTTISARQFDNICKHISKRFKETRIFHTICNATANRQKAANSLAKKVEAIIVIGGYNSSNTSKLVDICREVRPSATYHIETAADVNVLEMKSYNIVGVTAGASTPSQTINEVLNKLNNL
ncbi:MAG: 4-hydroxy-3-methylbut-2-enyl diphosphate reductase [Alkaliphilus sp.]